MIKRLLLGALSSPVRTAFRLAALAPLGFAAAFALSGCTENADISNSDRAFLTKPLHNPDLPNHPTDNLLPLVPGDHWQMRSAKSKTGPVDDWRVVGPVTPPNGVPSVLMDSTRNGKPWRKEFFAVHPGKQISLTGMQDETSPLMVFDSEIPVVRYPFTDGDYWSWEGFVTVGAKKRYPATATSRVSSVETLTTLAGTFKALHVDTVISINFDGHVLRFPSVRWLAPGVGIVQRSFAVKGLPSSSQVIQFNVR